MFVLLLMLRMMLYSYWAQELLFLSKDRAPKGRKLEASHHTEKLAAATPGNMSSTKRVEYVVRRASVVLSLVAAVSLVGLPMPWAVVDGQVGPEQDWGQIDVDGGEGKWVYSETTDGIKTAYLSLPGSSGIGLKGSVVVDHHIGSILNVFLNTTRSKEWVSYLDAVDEIPTTDRHLHIIYQYYQMPWPLGDRDWLVERVVSPDKRSKTVHVHYRSIEHPSKPVGKGVVRGETRNTCWRFRALGGKKTEIMVESQLNPKLPVSTRIVSVLQSSYQRSSLLSLIGLVSEAQPHPEYAHW